MRILVFTMPGCFPCNQLKPVLDELKEDAEYEGDEWAFLNIHETHGASMRQLFNVEKVPTVIALSDSGVELGRHVGGSVNGLLLMLRAAKQQSAARSMHMQLDF